MSGSAMGSPDARLPEQVDVAIVGGGIMGLSTAYHLSKLSRLRIAVIERSYLVSGASGRNGGGVRMQWADRGNVELMMQSIDMCRTLSQELGINLWFRQGGYLFLARTPEVEARLHESAELHREVGAPTRLLGPAEAKDLVPHLDVADVRVAAYNPEDGVVFPWPFVWGYASQAMERGVVIRTHTAVERLEPGDEGMTLALSTGEQVEAQTVINATGAWSVGINRSLGIELPNRPHRHEILSSEPLKPFLDPLIADLGSGLYCSQSTRGELVCGVGMPERETDDPTHIDLGDSLFFLRRLSTALTRILPITRGLKILRQWSGPYDVSPDGDGIVGPSPGFQRLIQMCGFTGHGFMMAPAVGQIVARFIAQGERHPMMERWSPARFSDGSLSRREDMILG